MAGGSGEQHPGECEAWNPLEQSLVSEGDQQEPGMDRLPDQDRQGPSGHPGYMQKCTGRVLVTERMCTRCNSGFQEGLGPQEGGHSSSWRQPRLGIFRDC